MKTKGFTLLELVIVIGILAVLGTVSVLVLNPAQLFAQARDTTRIQDLDTMKSALSLYLSSVSSPDLDFTGALSCTTMCFSAAAIGAAADGCTGADVVRHGTKTSTVDATRENDGNGWVPVALSGISGGAPLAVLPIDPSNTTTYFYSYACDNTAKTFELNANMESDRYKNGGNDDREINTKDGGTVNTIYEVGTDSGLDL